MIQLVLVLMQVVGRVGEGGEGDGEGGKVGEGAGEEGGRDPERPRQHRSCGEAQPLKFRLLEPFCFRSSVLEPDLHLQKKMPSNIFFATSGSVSSSIACPSQ